MNQGCSHTSLGVSGGFLFCNRKKKNGLAFGLTKVSRLNGRLTKRRKSIVSVHLLGQ